MAIDAKHPAYVANIDKWTRCRDCYEGDDAIKERGMLYLPKIDANQSSGEYASYASRATFFEAVGRSVDGFTGAISRRPHKINLPAKLDRMLQDATLDGIALAEIVKLLCKEVLLIGRAGVLVDYDETANRPFVVVYHAESIINWCDDRIVLRETVFEKDADDTYNLKPVEQLRELSLIEGVYTVTVWRKRQDSEYAAANEWIVYGEPVQPTTRGKPLDKMPFFWASILGPTPAICKPPLLGMVNLSLSHYRLSADYAHGLHWTGLPTLYVTGAASDETVRVGAAAAILLKDPAARVGFAEFRGEGLGSLEHAIAAKEQQMAVLGAAVIGEARRVETAEAARIRHSGETGLLMATVSAVQATLQAALAFAAEWDGAAGTVSVELNDDFVSARLDPQTLVGLVQAYQAGALTLTSLLQAMQDGDLLPQTADVTAEAAKLEAVPRQPAA